MLDLLKPRQSQNTYLRRPVKSENHLFSFSISSSADAATRVLQVPFGHCPPPRLPGNWKMTGKASGATGPTRGIFTGKEHPHRQALSTAGTCALTLKILQSNVSFSFFPVPPQRSMAVLRFFCREFPYDQGYLRANIQICRDLTTGGTIPVLVTGRVEVPYPVSWHDPFPERFINLRVRISLACA